MNVYDLQISQRVQIDVETESGMDTYRGIVMSIVNDKLIIVTDFGKLIEINNCDILSTKKISFDKYVSAAILNLKTYYEEKLSLEEKIKELKINEAKLQDDLLDANMVSRFNIVGARNRLEKSISKEMLNFERGEYLYDIYFSCNPNDEIEINFDVFYKFKLDINGSVDMDKVKEAYAPKERDVIKNSFARIGDVREVNVSVVHEDDNNYYIKSSYIMNIYMTSKTFLERRDDILIGLKNLRM